MACVHVCPTGIDIRDGQQMECIGCGLCIDACDDVMGKLGRQKGLIAFETLTNLAASEVAAKPMPPGPARQACGMQARTHLKFIRPRTLLYAGVLGLVVAVMGGSWALRQTTSLSVLRDRAPNFVRLSDGGVRNAYALKLGDKTRDVESYALVLDAPAGLQMVVQDAALDAAGPPGADHAARRHQPVARAGHRAARAEAAGERAGDIQAAGRAAAAPRCRTASVFLGPKP